MGFREAIFGNKKFDTPVSDRFRMAKLKKKGETGTAAKYITRNQALKRLQLGLPDFRRLCILKGIYPRDPKNKKKANNRVASNTTFYYTKDVMFLAHEPLLYKFRELKAFHKKLKKYLGRGEWAKVKSIEANCKPQLSLDHLVRERYPSFADALRDLDDPLSLIALFSTLPQTKAEGHRAETAKNCARLMREFEAYVTATGSLKKSFVSIKGIYYQAEIMGQPITWVTPHPFSTAIPTDVDFRVMLTFLEFYQTLLGFVNFRLFSRLGWPYPGEFVGDSVQAASLPPVQRDDDGASMVLEGQQPFRKLVFFLGREISVPSVGFVIQAMGGRCGWQDTSASEEGKSASPLAEDDPAITHQIVDRPALASMRADREYVQPQWVFDCLNAGTILDPAPYRIGQALPPHLSPFVAEPEAEEDLEAAVQAAEEEQSSTGPAAEKKKLAEAMLSKKHRKLYKQMQHSRQRKAGEKKVLLEKKKAVQAKKGKTATSN